MSVSILILTLNEETNIAACLRSLPHADDIIVFDSFSSDRTTEIAAGLGARIVQRKFDNWAAHQNWAMSNIPYKHPWVFYLDADELMTPELWKEITDIATDANEQRVAFYCGRKNYFMDRWIRHAMPPGLIMRFFRPDKIRFERLVNPTPVIDGPHGYLTHRFLHFNFSKGLAEWFTKHNNYSSFEAMEGVKILGAGEGIVHHLREMRNPDTALRRKAMKSLAFRFPARAMLRFLYVYVFKTGFLDGMPGLHYSILISIYEYWIGVKMKEHAFNWPEVNQRLAATNPDAVIFMGRVMRHGYSSASRNTLVQSKAPVKEFVQSLINDASRASDECAASGRRRSILFLPLWRFVSMYFLRLGFLEGRAGWHLAWLMAGHAYMLGVFCDEKRVGSAVRTASDVVRMADPT